MPGEDLLKDNFTAIIISTSAFLLILVALILWLCFCWLGLKTNQTYLATRVSVKEEEAQTEECVDCAEIEEGLEAARQQLEMSAKVMGTEEEQ